MKAIRFLLKVVLWIVAIVVVALLAMPLWFGPVVKTAANIAVPGVVKTDFHLGHIYLNPYTARFELRDLQLANPDGYSEKYAATVGDIAFDAETSSLATDVIHIEEIKAKDIFVSYVSGGKDKEKVNNFQQIQYNVAGGKEKYEQSKAEAADKAKREELQAKETAQAKRVEEPQEEKPSKDKKFIIDRLEVSGLVIQLGVIPLRVPSFTMTDIGKSSGGVSLSEIVQEVWAGILKAAGAVGDQLKALGNLTGDAAGQAAESATKAAAKMNKSFDKATKEATKAIDSLKKLW